MEECLLCRRPGFDSYHRQQHLFKWFYLARHKVVAEMEPNGVKCLNGSYLKGRTRMGWLKFDHFVSTHMLSGAKQQLSGNSVKTLIYKVVKTKPIRWDSNTRPGGMSGAILQTCPTSAPLFLPREASLAVHTGNGIDLTFAGKNSHFHILLNGLWYKMTGIIFILFPMHSLGLAGIPRCYSDKLDSYST